MNHEELFLRHRILLRMRKPPKKVDNDLLKIVWIGEGESGPVVVCFPLA